MSEQERKEAQAAENAEEEVQAMEDSDAEEIVGGIPLVGGNQNQNQSGSSENKQQGASQQS